MNDKVFLDTNILVYTYSNNELEKQNIARKLITDNDSFISTQVLQELTNTVIKKLKYSHSDALKTLNECINNNKVQINTETTILNACNIAERYGFSFYDSLIVAAAIECNCSILYSEDLQHNQIINNILKIVNPF